MRSLRTCPLISSNTSEPRKGGGDRLVVAFVVMFVEATFATVGTTRVGAVTIGGGDSFVVVDVSVEAAIGTALSADGGMTQFNKDGLHECDGCEDCDDIYDCGGFGGSGLGARVA